jgi:hypothetical protein
MSTGLKVRLGFLFTVFGLFVFLILYWSEPSDDPDSLSHEELVLQGEPTPATNAADPNDEERAPENTAAPERDPQVTQAVYFIRQNRHRHQAAADACWEMDKCTMYSPDNHGRVSLPKDSKGCLEEWIPVCEAALDELERYPAPQVIREDYRLYAHEPKRLNLAQNKLALDVLTLHGDKPLRMKRGSDGYYEDFWLVWAKKHYPKQAEAFNALWEQEMAVRMLQGKGTDGLRIWLNENNVCRPGHNCYPNKVEDGRVLADGLRGIGE